MKPRLSRWRRIFVPTLFATCAASAWPKRCRKGVFQSPWQALRTGETLCQNATFAVNEELMGADGRGWAFDDSTLFPQDPSVIRGYWHPVSPVQGAAAWA